MDKKEGHGYDVPENECSISSTTAKTTRACSVKKKIRKNQ
jgi:hypothetical protein